jgi:phosphate uptake regulator
MKRKVIKQGHNTMTITLPSKWSKNVGLKQGDYLNTIVDGNNLIISTSLLPSESKIKVDISRLDRTSALIMLQGLYRNGYDTIDVRYENEVLPHYRTDKRVSVSEVVHNVVNRFIGSEIISTTRRSYLIKNISKESRDEFDTSLRRVFRLLNEMMQTYAEGVANSDYSMLKSLEFMHINIKKFQNYCLRLLNKFGHNNQKLTPSYFSIVQYLSKSEDIIKNATRFTLKHKLLMTEKSQSVIRRMQEVLTDFYKLFYDYRTDKLAPLYEKRDNLRIFYYSNSKTFNKDELTVLGGLLQINEIILDLIELRIAIEDMD